MRVMVVGARGFIGSHVCASLRSMDWTVLEIDTRKETPGIRLGEVDAVVYLASSSTPASSNDAEAEIQRNLLPLCRLLSNGISVPQKLVYCKQITHFVEKCNI